MGFLSVLNQILVLFLLLLCGLIARKLNILDSSLTKGLSTLLIKLSLPALIISSMNMKFSPNLLKESGQILIISLAVYILSFFAAWIVSKVYKNDSDVGIYQFITVFSNVGFMGYPVVEAILGKEALFYTAIYNLPFNLLLFTIGIYYLSRQHDYKHPLNLKILLNPGIIAVLIGFTLFLLGNPLPTFINNTISMLGSITTPLSMLIVGSILTQVSVKKLFTHKRLYVISIIRLIILPVVVLGLLSLFIDQHYLIAVPTIIAAMPAAANAAILSEEYGTNPEVASQGVFITTLLSIITIPFISLLLVI